MDTALNIYSSNITKQAEISVVVDNIIFTISEKNMRAYKKLNHLPVDADAIRIYLDACYHEEISSLIKKHSINELNQTINDCIEDEVHDCGGDDFY